MPFLDARTSARFARRSWQLDLCLAATALFLWNLLNCIDILLGFGFDSLRFALDVRGWRTEWPWRPAMVAALGLAAVFFRCRRRQPTSAILQPMLRKVTYLAAALIVLRLLSLADVAGYLLPYLSLLWSPHASWAFGTTFLLPAAAGISRTGMNSSRLLADSRLCALTFLLSAATFSGYTLYFCQLTMLHGDEGQYLLVTQSLIRDGDMDLTNNIDPKSIREFHVIDSFGIHKAPGSPPGKLHSVHPVGLSILLIPPYLAGLDLWQNPRLACALTVALMGAGCVALMLAWLLRLGIGRWPAVAAAMVAAVTGPLFLYSTQLFPDLPALLVSLVALRALHRWQIPGGGYRSWGRLETLWLALLSAVLGFLPFLHARFTPIALLACVGLALQIRGNPKPRTALISVLGVFAVVALLLVRFNIAFSGDWLGPFKPGNAWEEGALDIGTWWVSLPGHWLHGRVGLVNSSPIYLFSLLGLALLATTRDRRLLVALGVYAATAAVNGMHPDWRFGFCMPARFLITALPCLVLGLAVSLKAVARNPGLVFLALFALAISLDSIGIDLVLSEEAYVGDNLFARSINHYYPWQAHFNSDETLGFFAELLFLGLTLACIFAPLLFPRLRVGWPRMALLLAAALMPAVWGQTDRFTARLKQATSHVITSLNPEGGIGSRKTVGYDLNLKALSVPAQADGSIRAHGGEDSPGLIARAYMPTLEPGSYVLKLPDLEVQAPSSEPRPPGHLLFLRRETVHAKSIWETRMSLPLNAEQPQPEMIFHINRTALGFTYLHFSGSGVLNLRRCRLLYSPGFGNLRSREIHRATGGVRASPELPLAHLAQFPALAPGSYAVRATFSGTTVHTLFERTSPPIEIAVFLNRPDPAGSSAESRIRAWFGSKRDLLSISGRGRPVLPLIETLQPPWWTAIPVLGADQFRLDFSVFEAADVWVATKYGGPLDLQLKEIVLTGIEPPHRRWTD